MDKTFTPGSWRVEVPDGGAPGSTRIIGATGAVVALMKSAGGRKAGNATLIAAAPAMLAALQMVGAFDNPADGGHVSPEGLAMIRAAIAAATGTPTDEFRCSACGRAESECSAEPCDDVKLDRIT